MLLVYVFELGERVKDSLEEARESKVGLSLVLLLVSLICHDGHFCLMFVVLRPLDMVVGYYSQVHVLTWSPEDGLEEWYNPRCRLR